MYVVLRQADTGDVDTLVVYPADHEEEANELARLVNERDNGPDPDPMYKAWVEFTPCTTFVLDTFDHLFPDE